VCSLLACVGKPLNGIRWNDADAVQIINDVSTELLLKQKGTAKDLAPLDLTDEPELVDFLARVDLSELSK
jgi:hypothetical protein